MPTGLYPASHHVHSKGTAHFAPGEVLVTRRLADACWHCGLVGKLHLFQAKGHEARLDDGYRMYQWSHHPLPDLAPEHVRHEMEAGVRCRVGHGLSTLLLPFDRQGRVDTCYVTGHYLGMIRTFRHKGLKALYEKNQTKGLNPQWLKRIRAILARLDASKEPADMDFPGLRLHPMKGEYKGFWAVDVSGNWRIVFRFEEQEPHDVDLVDYH